MPSLIPLAVATLLLTTVSVVNSDQCFTSNQLQAFNDRLEQMKTYITQVQQALTTGTQSPPGNPLGPSSTPAPTQSPLKANAENPGAGTQAPPSHLANVSFCYVYRPFPGNPKQNTDSIGAAGNQNCAPLNSMTSYFPDVNSEISWSISVGLQNQISYQMNSDWMFGIQLCVRGKPVTSGKCNGQDRTFTDCIQIDPNNNNNNNRFLRYINILNPNYNGGGCALSWSLILPPNTPTDLASNLKLCVAWVQTSPSPTGSSDTQQQQYCAAAVAMDSSTNPRPVPQWTEDWVNDADANGINGYNIQWGIFYTTQSNK